MNNLIMASSAAAFLLLAGAPVCAKDDAAAQAASEVTSQITPDVEAQIGIHAESGLFDTRAVSESALHAIAGREDTSQVSQADLKAGVSNNSVGDNAITGAAQIDGNAFQNMSGLSILNVNTGNNVAISAAMNVNISISPAP